MKTRKNQIIRIVKKLKLHILALVLLITVGSIFHVVLRMTLLQNYQHRGTLMAQNYAAEVEGDLNMYKTLLALGAESVDILVREGKSSEEISSWIAQYCERLQHILGESVIDPYVIFQGEMIFTDVYTDAISHRNVITLAQKCYESDLVLAFAVFPENLFSSAVEDDLVEGASVYICDASGNLLYSDSILNCSDEELAEYLGELQSGIQNGTLNQYDSYIIDLENNQRGVYYDYMYNDWITIITVSFDTILNQLHQYTMLFGLVMLVGISGFLFITLRNLKLDFMIERTNETIRVLGNTYYALYRINYEEDTYEMIKGSDYVQDNLPPSGPYSELLRVAGEVMEPAVFKDFCKSFSSDSIRNLVFRRIRDYGGDFLRRFGDEYRWVSVRVLFNESLSHNEAVLCFREVELEKKLQLQERKLLEEALESSRNSEKAKHAFFNNMSHDMRTPLNAILGLSDLTCRYADDPQKVRSYVQKISYNSQQLLDLVNDILDISRMEQGKVILNNQAFDLKDCVSACVDSFRIQAETEKKNFQIIYEIQDAHVMGDSIRISQILNNLLSNAFKFTSEGDLVSVTVRQLGSAKHSQYQIVVKDTGIGMFPDFLPHLFEPYSRETRFTARQISGTGLGMPIVKNLVTQMSGQIYVDSKLGEGTTFTITVPFVLANKSFADESYLGKKENSEDNFSLEGKKILLAEDNVVNLEIATEILNMNGLAILQAWNGLEAVELFKASAPFEIDAILMDMQMPQMDGCEAARIIRAMPRPDAKLVPILAVTANAFAEDIAATTAAGMDAHIPKPINYDVLFQTLKRLTEEKTNEYKNLR